MVNKFNIHKIAYVPSFYQITDKLKSFQANISKFNSKCQNLLSNIYIKDDMAVFLKIFESKIEPKPLFLFLQV